MGNAGSAPEQAKKAEEAEGGPPSTVRFFPSATQHTARQPPPIKLEEEDLPPPPGTAAEEQEDHMAPRNLWQVYALGAFLVARWGWAKWKESQDRDDSADGQSPDGSS